MYYNEYEYPIYDQDERFFPLAVGLGLGTFGFRPWFVRPYFNPFFGFYGYRPWYFRRRRRYWY